MGVCMAETKPAAIDMVRDLAEENRQLQIQVLEERLLGLKAQRQLADVLMEKTEAELAQLRQ
jgi:hypothetical protein